MTDANNTVAEAVRTTLGTAVPTPPGPPPAFVENSLSLAKNRRTRQRRWVVRILVGAALFGAGLLVGLRGRRPATTFDNSANGVPAIPGTSDTVSFVEAVPALLRDMGPPLVPVFAVIAGLWLVVAAIRRWRIARPLPTAALVAFAVASIGIGLLVALRLAVSVYFIPSASMEPSLSPGARVLVARYDTDIAIGDVIIFRDPHATTEYADRIKRVVALEGDTVSVEDGQLLVNGTPSIAIPIDPEQPIRPTRDATLNSTVGPGEVFVMGDNYNNSHDSRHTGPIGLDDVVATVRWGSGGNLRSVDVPDSNP